MLGQLGKNALPGGLQIFIVYESKSPSLTKILECVTNMRLPGGSSIDFLDKVFSFEGNIFKNFTICVDKSDSVFVIRIDNRSGFGRINEYDKYIIPECVINVNGSMFFFIPLKGVHKRQICYEFIEKFLKPTNETYGYCQGSEPHYIDLIHRFDIYLNTDGPAPPAWICETNENHEWQISYRSLRWPWGIPVFINVAPSKFLPPPSLDYNLIIRQIKKSPFDTYKKLKNKWIESGDSECGIVPNREHMKRYLNDLPKECRERAKKETIINELQ